MKLLTKWVSILHFNFHIPKAFSKQHKVYTKSANGGNKKNGMVTVMFHRGTKPITLVLKNSIIKENITLQHNNYVICVYIIEIITLS